MGIRSFSLEDTVDRTADPPHQVFGCSFAPGVNKLKRTRKLEMDIIYTPEKLTNGGPQNDALENATEKVAQIWLFLVSMLPSPKLTVRP